MPEKESDTSPPETAKEPALTAGTIGEHDWLLCHDEMVRCREPGSGQTLSPN